MAREIIKKHLFIGLTIIFGLIMCRSFDHAMAQELTSSELRRLYELQNDPEAAKDPAKQKEMADLSARAAAAKESEGASKGMNDSTMATFCNNWDENLAEYSGQENCWSCKIFIMFFDAANKIAGQVNGALTGPAGKILILGVALWTVFNVAALFSSVTDAPDIMGFLTKFGGMILKAGFAWCFLEGGSSLAFHYIVNPVLSAAAGLSAQVLSLTNSAVNCTIDSNSMVDGSINAPMGAGVRDSLDCMIKAIASGMARSQSIAQGLRCGSFFWFEVDFWFLPGPKFYIMNPLMWLFGMMLGCLFWIISFMFPIAMLDVIFRIGLLVAMLPMFILAWVFPITARFAKTAWDIFLHSCMVFTITGLIIGMIVTMVETSWVAGSGGNFEEFQAKMEASSYVEAWNMLFDAGLGAGLASLFIVMTVGVWGIYLAPVPDKLSKSFLGSSLDFPDSCAIKAIRGTLFFIVDVIMFIITLISFGATACVYALKFFSYLKRTMDALRKVQDALEKAKKMQERIQKLQEKINKVQSVANKVKSGVQTAKNAFNSGTS